MESLIANLSPQPNPNPATRSIRPHPSFALLIFATVIAAGIFILIGLGDSVPTALYAVLFGSLTAAGVAVPTA